MHLSPLQQPHQNLRPASTHKGNTRPSALWTSHKTTRLDSVVLMSWTTTKKQWRPFWIKGVRDTLQTTVLWDLSLFLDWKKKNIYRTSGWQLGRGEYGAAVISGGRHSSVRPEKTLVPRKGWRVHVCILHCKLHRMMCRLDCAHVWIWWRAVLKKAAAQTQRCNVLYHLDGRRLGESGTLARLLLAPWNTKGYGCREPEHSPDGF